MKLSKPSVNKVKQEVAAAIQQHSGRLSVGSKGDGRHWV